MHAHSPSEHDLPMVVADKETIADGIVRLELRACDGHDLPSWTPGSHIDVTVGADVIRQYSLCGDPGDRTTYEIAVLKKHQGRGGSAYVHDRLEVGERLRVKGPRNHFALVAAPSYVFIAGGIGITPIRAMIRSVGSGSARWSLTYGGRSRSSMAFREELVAVHGDRVRLRPQDEFGPIDIGEVLAELDDPQASVVYCCGPAPLLEAVTVACGARGIGVHVERFMPRAAPKGSEDEAFELELARSGRTINVPADRTIVAALEAVGVTIPTSCEEGICGTCETAVLGGLPEHRDSLLTDEERVLNDTMMPCVSRSRSSRLVLDL
ncbi:PDR/VanB family oxidoreductase [Gordonia rubripertincta]|uniref:PDR/VanB family oxidoreductase n=2 Tax=Gordonia rubripertincta TaxID=36822 RepID=A0AAW6RDN5_GORRU|nr:PDR/VanB family oxidoreductase [Gordonia rubripertincta]MDG6782112.1 PDR/VanB family oxidoreductase [Gordonia rubripertincta]NKY64673.1 oxidoreductase [Gordonia rubripertincta]